MNRKYIKKFLSPNNLELIISSVNIACKRDYSYTLTKNDKIYLTKIMKELSDIKYYINGISDIKQIKELNKFACKTLLEYINTNIIELNKYNIDNQSNMNQISEGKLSQEEMEEKIKERTIDLNQYNKNMEIEENEILNPKNLNVNPYDFNQGEISPHKHEIEDYDIKQNEEQEQIPDLIQPNPNKNLLTEPKEKMKKIMNKIKTDRMILNEEILLIDSKDRNYDLFPYPNNYILKLGTTYKDIYSIELISAILPKSNYVINSYNNTIIFNEGGSDITVSIESGNYTISTLLSTIKSAMDTAGSLTYTLSNNTLNNKITISATGTFSLLFDGGEENYYDGETRTIYPENSIAPVLGFSRSDYTGLSSYTGENMYNLLGENYVLLYIKDLENLKGSVVSNVIHDNFCKIQLNVDNTTFKYYTEEADYISKKLYNPVLAKLDRLTIKFYTYNGDLYDFNGLEHTLQFRIKMINKNNNIVLNT